MRSYIFGLCCLAFFTASCGNSPEPATAVEQPSSMEEMAEGAPKYTRGAKMDPVCEMEWDNEWTELTVYNGDTVRFCSEGCKMAFEAHPGKYMAPGQ